MDDAEPDLAAVHRLRAVTVELNLLAAEFAQRHGLHPTDLRALILLLDTARSGGTATPGTLGRGLGLNSAGTTALVDRLERLGHVRRTRDPGDRRKVLLEVDGKAVALGWSFFGPIIDDAVAAMRTFTNEQRDAIDRFLLTMHGIAHARRSALAASGDSAPHANGPRGRARGPEQAGNR